MIRDPDGNIVFAKDGAPVEGRAKSGDKALVQFGYVFADDGTKIYVAKNLSSDKRFDCNCHGATFGDGQFWIGNEAIEELLAGDNYVEAEGDVYVGDVVIDYNKDGEIVHSTTVVGVDDETGDITVTGLGDLTMKKLLRLFQKRGLNQGQLIKFIESIRQTKLSQRKKQND